MPGNASAQTTDETLIEFTSSNATMEDDPKKGAYNITIFSPDGQWKMQLNYHADSMFGTFNNDDFRLSGEGKYYNFARNPKNDMVFYSFVDMNVSVAYEDTLYRVKANCLTNNKTRFIVEATIDAPKPKETRTDSLGYARLEENGFYGTWAIYAENDNYKLGYGIVSEEVLGTFYRADLLMPELYDKKAGKQISIINATAVHTQKGDSTLFHIDILSDDLIQYSLDMFNGRYDIDITDEQEIEMHNMVLQDLTEMYGCYQFGATNDVWGMAVAVKPESLTSGKTRWTRDDLVMQYTQLVTVEDLKSVDIFDINAYLMQNGDETILTADVTTMEGILYHVIMHSGKNTNMPAASDTINIDFGHIAVLDYTQGIGTIGLGAVKQGKYQMRCFFNTYDITKDLANEDFVLDLCDVMVVDDERQTYVFHDAKMMRGQMEVVDGRTNITIDMLGVDDVLYHATMYIDDMECMHDMEMKIGSNEALMIGVQEGTDGQSAEYTVQFQDTENVYDEDYNIVGDGYALSFYFGHEGTAAVAGDYGYSAGTLAEDECHTFFEHGCEVRVGAVAGTLSLEPIEKVSVRIGAQTVSTYIYNAKFQFVGQNGILYKGEGENYLLCIGQNEYVINLDEPTFNAIRDVLTQKGYRVRKALNNGKVIIEKMGKTYDAQGIKTK